MSSRCIVPRSNWQDSAEITHKIIDGKHYSLRRIACIKIDYTFVSVDIDRAVTEWLSETEKGEWYYKHTKHPSYLDVMSMDMRKVIWMSGFVADEDWCWYVMKWGMP